MHIYAELVDMNGFEDVHVEPHLLIKPDSGETPQAASLLAAALREGESEWEEWTAGSSLGQIIQGNKVQQCCLVLRFCQVSRTGSVKTGQRAFKRSLSSLYLSNARDGTCQIVR